MKRGITLLGGLLLAAMALPAAAVELGDAERGAELAGTCQACHGPTGNADNPAFPRLAGQHADYLAAALRQYQNGERSNAIMQGIVSGLSKQDMRDLAAYFSGQQGDLYTPER
ncbi:cytochrome c [Alkalilimnicola sp. S0819]|nr:cytochrome c [Alkalilimnicola sp. S0819]MPQ17065.1 c-type cytochrome [Alkalilimnicola sp. S0819]